MDMKWSLRTAMRMLVVALLLFACLGAAALADTLALPQGTKWIETEAFYGDTSIDRVVLGNDVMSIGTRAFANSSLKEIDLPASLTYIADSAFSGMSKVTATAPKGSYAYNWALDHDNVALTGSCGTNCTWTLWQGTLTIAGTGAMKNYTDASPFPADHVTRIVIKNGVTAIGQYAFYGLENVTSVTIPSTVTSIKNHSFDGCSSLTRVIIPDDVTVLGEFAFGHCASLVSARVPNSVTSMGNAVFYDCFALSDVTIPNGLTVIKSSTFSGCRALESITIPDSVTSIGS
ncbi:MAG: leucine-rich repeat domain-containing protein, partial [Clostridiales bacterium]|nr:leucine-rich repeat domain-containing protein [Clostridiales bacterium]